MASWQPQVSVIMPAHHVGQAVCRALESMQAQTERDFELLVVVDGPDDPTEPVVQRFADRDYRIGLVREQAGSDGRNQALDRARGTYLAFVDGRDWAEPRLLEGLLSLAQDNRLELVVAAFCVDNATPPDDETSCATYERPQALYPTQQEFRAAAWQLFDQDLLHPLWNKLFLRERVALVGARFQPGPAGALPFVLGYLRDVERVGVLEQPRYHFVPAQRLAPSTTWLPDLYRQREDEHEQMLELYHHWGLDGDAACMEMLQRHYLTHLLRCIENVCQPACTLPTREKVALIEQMIGSDRAQLAVATTRPRSRAMRTLLAPVKARNARLAYHEGRLLSLVNRNRPSYALEYIR